MGGPPRKSGCFGERYHRAWTGELCLRDQLRNQRLMELGWDVQRFWVYQVRDELGACVERVGEWVAVAFRAMKPRSLFPILLHL